MVYVSQTTNVNTTEIKKGVPALLDPGQIKAARQIYQTYFRLHSKLNKTPVGVAIDRKTYRGQLLFTKRPILLPWENFIPIEHLESEIR